MARPKKMKSSPSLTTAVPLSAAGTGSAEAKRLCSKAFSADEVLVEIGKYEAAPPAHRTLLLFTLQEIAEVHESKQVAAFRSTLITLISVLVAISALLVPPALEMLIDPGVSSARILQLEREMDATDRQLTEFARTAQLERQANPKFAVSEQQLRELYESASAAGKDYYSAMGDNIWADLRAVIALVGVAASAAILITFWRRQNERATGEDRMRARAATWLKALPQAIPAGTKEKKRRWCW
ncbi:hypothetical membrane protein [Clavibacter nebraskensis NCPPB 2581]|uniref:Hypothetical membrane protein n=1 Tax=Clavibacter nebraskensis NCPPB 2581 TaxID=1097677 RepID=A0AAI8ZKG9_9MICO|nr:hypothetical membrane protein [Clavibacter nebraskensis NCPPB 2581]